MTRGPLSRAFRTLALAPGRLILAAAFFAFASSAWASPDGADRSDRSGEASRSGQAEAAQVWRELEPGLEYGEFGAGNPGASGLSGLAGWRAARLTVLRIDPARFEFVLGASTADGSGARPLGEWAKDENLAAAVNASMYLPDGKTSAGYLRVGEHLNNPRIPQGFGAFFAAGPRRPGLPEATIIEKGSPGWRAALDDYRMVVQNFRLTDSRRRVLWSPGGRPNAISAVGQDGAGRILFLHSQTPLDAHSFARLVLELPLDARVAMYVEGGAQAGLLLRTEKLTREISAPHAPSLLATGDPRAALPNILGARPKRGAEKPLQN